jgi:methyl-accepting chemotaxis protein
MSVASAVEEQRSATGEISRNVQEAATGTREVSANITSVHEAAQETGAAASEMRNAATNCRSNLIRCAARLRPSSRIFAPPNT